MHNLYNSNVDCRVHQFGERENAALHKVQQDRLAALAESTRPQTPRLYTRIAAYLRHKFHFQFQQQVYHHENQTTPYVAGIE